MKLNAYLACFVLVVGTACGAKDQLSGQEFSVSATSVLSCSSSGGTTELMSVGKAVMDNTSGHSATSYAVATVEKKIAFSGGSFDFSENDTSLMHGSFSHVDEDTLKLKLADGRQGTVDYAINESGQFVIKNISCTSASTIPANTTPANHVPANTSGRATNYQMDSDGDGIFDNQDAYPYDSQNQADSDSDGDGTPDTQDSYPYQYNAPGELPQ